MQNAIKKFIRKVVRKMVAVVDQERQSLQGFGSGQIGSAQTYFEVANEYLFQLHRMAGLVQEEIRKLNELTENQKGLTVGREKADPSVIKSSPDGEEPAVEEVGQRQASDFFNREWLIETAYTLGAVGHLPVGSRCVIAGAPNPNLGISLASLGYEVIHVDPRCNVNATQTHPLIKSISSDLANWKGPTERVDAIVLAFSQRSSSASTIEEPFPAPHVFTQVATWLKPQGKLVVVAAFDQFSACESPYDESGNSFGEYLAGWEVLDRRFCIRGASGPNGTVSNDLVRSGAGLASDDLVLLCCSPLGAQR
jgi:hypothetical protein